MAWRLAKGLERLRDQVNEKYPGRSKESDGSIGDTAHSARKSDHNPDAKGVVHAIDITHDPRNGFDSYKFAEHLLRTQDPRLSYVISNGKIGSGPKGPAPGIWRKYGGSNPHDHHVHVSIVDGSLADDVRDWDIGANAVKPQPAASVVRRTLRPGDHDPEVTKLKAALKAKGVAVSLRDDIFDNETKLGVMVFQLRNGLEDDGIVGPQTWKALA
jgi:hypothetical protein